MSQFYFSNVYFNKNLLKLENSFVDFLNDFICHHGLTYQTTSLVRLVLTASQIHETAFQLGAGLYHSLLNNKGKGIVQDKREKLERCEWLVNWSDKIK